MNDINKSSKWDFLKRPSVPALDKRLGVPVPALNHGFVRIIDYMGDEGAVCQAARVSYGKGTKSVSNDRGLLRYLMRHKHTTPFEMCELKLHIKMPIFVARQWIRHRTASVNEYSARYSILSREFFIPELDDIQPQSSNNAQGREGELPVDVREMMTETIRQQGEMSFQLYEELYTGWPWLREDGLPWGVTHDMKGTPTPHSKEHGMAREMARGVLPLNTYTEMYWKIDLHNLLHFLRLRADPHAQKEIRVYADIMCDMVEEWVPNIWEAFVDYVKDSHTFSAIEMDILRELVADQIELGIPYAQGMSEREHKEFVKALGYPEEELEKR